MQHRLREERRNGRKWEIRIGNDEGKKKIKGPGRGGEGEGKTTQVRGDNFLPIMS